MKSQSHMLHMIKYRKIQSKLIKVKQKYWSEEN